MDILQGMWSGFAVCLAPTKLLACLFGVVVGTAMGVAAGDRARGGRGPADPSDLSYGCGLRRHHDRGDLLRDPVRWVHHLHPRQHPGRGGLRHHLPGRTPDDPPGQGGCGARDLRLRVVHRRDHRGGRPDAGFPAARGVCAEVRPPGDLCPRVSGLHARGLSLQRLDDPRPDDGRYGPPAGDGRPGGDHGDPAFHLRQCESSVGDRYGPPDDGAFRGQRGPALPGKHETRGG